MRLLRIRRRRITLAAKTLPRRITPRQTPIVVGTTSEPSAARSEKKTMPVARKLPIAESAVI